VRRPLREFSRAQYESLLPRWAELYEETATVYGLNLAAGYTWGDMALLFNAVNEGVTLRTRLEGVPQLSNGEGVLTSAIFAMLPTLLDNCPSNLDKVFPVG
jgi:hypothetical protein